ncbi:MAG TPA: universal stress protein [Solirubrobacteraceae bacterium]|nr:universal stress protein [Solirubrobacteraceae bacterium]
MTSHPKIVVGIDGTPRGEDAVAFATVLARMIGTGLLLTYIYGPEETLADAHALLDPRRDAITGVTTEVTAYSDPSPARGLARVAAARHADIIVVGSSHRAGVGLVVPGSTGERLLHDSARAIVIVPRYLRAPRTGALARIGCGYDGSAQSEAALATATALTQIAHGELDMIESVTGDPANALTARSHDLDLLVLGSRGKGPVNAAVTGSVSSHVIRKAACPVLVVTHDAPVAVAA